MVTNPKDQKMMLISRKSLKVGHNIMADIFFHLMFTDIDKLRVWHYYWYI